MFPVDFRAEHLRRCALPYVSPLPAWMPGKEAIEQIKSADKCSESDAIAQLRAAVVDHAIPIRFRGRIVPKLPIGHPLGFFSDGPGASRMMSIDWRGLLLPTAQFRGDGMVNFSQEEWQPFEIRRNAIERYWPVGQVSTSAAEQKCKAWLIEDLKSRGAEQRFQERAPPRSYRKVRCFTGEVSIGGFGPKR